MKSWYTAWAATRPCGRVNGNDALVQLGILKMKVSVGDLELVKRAETVKDAAAEAGG